jgi:hypothetical protein
MSNQMKTKTRKLTENQEKFVRALLEGKSQIDAYKIAYNSSKASDECLHVHASQLANSDKCRIRYNELKKEVDKQVIKEIAKTRTAWTKEKLIDEFEAIKEMCLQKTKNYKTGEVMFKDGGALRSLENIGELLGMYEKKSELDITVKMPNIMIANTAPNLQIEGFNGDCVDAEIIEDEE